jgi:hypothetical protein
MRTVDNVMNGSFIPAPAPINRSIVALTERGHRLLALLKCREILPASSTTVAAVLDRRIGQQFADAGAD